MSCDTTSVDQSSSVNQECARQVQKKVPKRTPSACNLEVMRSHEGRIELASRQREDLLTAIEVREEHIAILQDTRERWNTMTESAKEMVGRFHTEDDLNAPVLIGVLQKSTDKQYG